MPAPRGEFLQHFGKSSNQNQPEQVQTSRNKFGYHVEILKDHVHKTYEETHGPGKAWQKLPEIPTATEILPYRSEKTAYVNDDDEEEEEEIFEEPILPVNIIDGPWNSKEGYIETHYKLLREDGIAPLRKAVEIFKTQPGMMDSGDVFIVGYTMSPQGPAPKVEFSHERSGKRIRWTQSKRLQQGTIVALTPRSNMFQSICRIAVVAARPISGVQQNPPQIDLFWGDENEAQFDPTEEYIMVESRLGYFEAYRHLLVAMQKLMTESFPLSDHLVKLNKGIGPPQYIENQPLTNLNALLPRPFENDNETTAHNQPNLIEWLNNVDILNSWPTIPNTSLDDSQLMALKRILAKKLAIIQGPPGTGKTFVSVSALKIMLDNWSVGDPPIIVSAQTNHAIDQLLSKLDALDPQFQSSFIRLGGRTSEDNKIVIDRTIYEVRQKDRIRNGGKNVGGYSLINCRKAVEGAGVVLMTVINRAMDQTDNEIQLLLEAGIITKEQFDSLNDDEWVCAHDPNLPSSIMASWLGSDQWVAAPKCVPTNLGFQEEEIDENFEELEEQEAEKRMNDDDDMDALRGKVYSFKEGFTGRHTPGYSEKKIRKILKRNKNLWNIDSSVRGEVYRYLRRQLMKSILDSFRQHFKSYMRATKNLKVARWDNDHHLIDRNGIKLIGCTTTGLSKYRGLLASLQPRTLLIEEAAETLEGTVLAAQFETLQHLILVGDHQQLRANCNMAALGGAPFHLAISMFERLVSNGMEFIMLNKQRRMISGIRELLNDVYPNLQDHEVVLDRKTNRKPIPGMGGRDCYWFHHTWPERKDDSASRYNVDEAHMIANFFAYLVLNGINPSQVTILTFYNGQRKVLVKELRKNPHLRSYSGIFNVFTVDSYQGEENDIILLSLVRSNNFAEIGFLENKNRAVVSLSRACRGMYIFGNLHTLFLKDRENETNCIWRDVTGKLAKSSPPRLDRENGLPVVCSNHHNETIIYEPQDFDALTGGCTLKCNGELPCGHACPYNCHSFSHEAIVCKMPCEKQCPGCDKGHSCSEICGHSCRCPCGDPVSMVTQEIYTELYEPTLDDVMNNITSKLVRSKSRSYQRIDSQVSAPRTSSPVFSKWRPNPWELYNAQHSDEGIARTQASKSFPQAKTSADGPAFRETHRPVVVENGVRKKGAEAATTHIITSAGGAQKDNYNANGDDDATSDSNALLDSIQELTINFPRPNTLGTPEFSTDTSVYRCHVNLPSRPLALNQHMDPVIGDGPKPTTPTGTEKMELGNDDLISFD